MESYHQIFFTYVDSQGWNTSFFFIEEVEILVAITDFTHAIFSLVSLYIGGCNDSSLIGPASDISYGQSCQVNIWFRRTNQKLIVFSYIRV